MTTAMTFGQIPFKVATPNGYYLVADSLPVKMGKCVVCYDHWLDGSDYVFRHPALWFTAADGIAVFHTLDRSHPTEEHVYQLIRDEAAYFSMGADTTPAATRAAVDGWNQRRAARGVYPVTRTRPFKGQVIGHLAYVLAPAIKQPPVWAVGGA